MGESAKFGRMDKETRKPGNQEVLCPGFVASLLLLLLRALRVSVVILLVLDLQDARAEAAGRRGAAIMVIERSS